MDVQLVNDVRPDSSLPWRMESANLMITRTQGPVTLILDSTTDAPAPPTAKVKPSNELKEKRKEELAAKALAKSERIAREKAEREQEGLEVNGKTATREELVQKEEELIAEAERKSKELADRFKVAMTESY